MSSEHVHSRALGFTVVALSVALEETLKALAEKNGNQPGPWLDELQDVALFRAQAHLSERAAANEADAAKAALAVAAHIFTKAKGSYTGIVIE
jgi:hypothetical protein